LDIPGCLLLAATCITLMVGLSFLSAGNLPFSSVKVWGNFASSATCFAILLWFEAYIATEPIIPLALLKNRTVSGAAAYYFFSSLGIALYFFFPVYFRSVLLQSASEAGFHLLSCTIATAVGSFTFGALISRTGRRYKYLMLIGSGLVILTPVYVSTWSDTNIPSTFGQNLALVPFGFGGAAMSTMMIVCVLASTQRESQATALGLVYLARSLGCVVGISAFGAQIQYVLTAQLTKHITGPNAVEIIDKIRKKSNTVRTLPDDLRIIALRAYSSALHITNISIAVIFVVSFLIVLFIKEIPLNKGKKAETTSDLPADEEIGDTVR
jgi:hypothetical protein